MKPKTIKDIIVGDSYRIKPKDLNKWDRGIDAEGVWKVLYKGEGAEIFGEELTTTEFDIILEDKNSKNWILEYYPTEASGEKERGWFVHSDKSYPWHNIEFEIYPFNMKLKNIRKKKEESSRKQNWWNNEKEWWKNGEEERKSRGKLIKKLHDDTLSSLDENFKRLTDRIKKAKTMLIEKKIYDNCKSLSIYLSLQNDKKLLVKKLKESLKTPPNKKRKIITEEDISKSKIRKISRQRWSKEEKKLFDKNYKIYQRKWSKYNIPNRTHVQIKSYGYKYKKKKEEEEGGVDGLLMLNQAF
jgi:hypothetical protein